MLSTQGLHAPPRDVELVAGLDNVIALDAMPSVRCCFTCVMPFPGEWRRCEFAVRDATGQVVAEESGATSSGVGITPWNWCANLPFAELVLEANLDGQRRTWPLDLRAATDHDAVRRISLR